jgi:peptidoglycan/LPS O-acetylase OafA/YrhL
MAVATAQEPPIQPGAHTADPGKQERLASGVPVVAAFDGYRAYAIGGIVLLHLLIFSGVLPVAGSSHLAVLVQGTLAQLIDVLFVVSGFVVFLPTVARGGNLGPVGAYAIRRAARLIPAYWVALGIGLVVLAVVPLKPPIAFPGLASIALHVGFLQVPAMLVRHVEFGFGLDVPVWTLSLEVAFYALAPLVAAWYARRPLLGLAVVAALTVLWHESIVHLHGVESLLDLHPSAAESLRLRTAALFQFPFFAFSFALGMTGAWAYVRFARATSLHRHSRRIHGVQLGSFAVLAVCAYLVGHQAAEHGLLLGSTEDGRLSPPLALGYSTSLAVLMVSTCLAGARGRAVFAHPVARRLGDISYGIYLIHMVIVICALHALGFPSDGTAGAFLALAGVTIPAALLYGYASARFLEQPIRRWAHRFGRRAQDEKGLDALHENAPAGTPAVTTPGWR